MGEITELYIEALPSGSKIEIENIGELDGQRPAWLEVNVNEGKAGFICYWNGKSTRTYYKKLLCDYYVPLDVTPKEWIQLNDHWAPFYDQIDRDQKELNEFIVGKVRRYVKQTFSALEIFAKTGSLSSELAAYCSTIDISEGSSAMMKIAQQRSQLARANWIQGEIISSVYLQNQRYDCVVCSKGLHVFGEPIQTITLKKVHFSLKPDGVCVVVGRISPRVIRQFFSVLEEGLFQPSGNDRSPLPYYIIQKVGKTNLTLRSESEISVNAIIRNAEKVLLVHRVNDDRSFGGFWAVPGGKVEEGESLLGALDREIREEISVPLTVKYPRLVGERLFFKQDGQRIFSLTFLVPYDKWDISIQKGEFSEYAWVGKDDFDKYHIIPDVKEDLMKVV